MGANGAGKTTLMKLMTGDCYPIQAEESYVELFGKRRYNIWDIKKHMGIITNDIQERYRKIAGDATGEMVVLSGYNGGIGFFERDNIFDEHRTKVLSTMKEMGISYLRNEKLADMSSGEARRIIIARALTFWSSGAYV
jgi:iron complex transport system ATP-binding protein